MKRPLAILTAIAVLAAASPALADGYGREYFRGGGFYGHGGYGYRHFGPRYYGHRYYGPRYYGPRYYGHRYYGYRHHGDYGYAVFGALAGGVVLGYLLTRPTYPTVVYAAPPVYQNCQPTTGTGYVNGHLAEFAGTWCVDQYGNASVIPGSERFLRYLN